MAEWRHSRLVCLPPVYVCLCNGVTERDIRQAAHAGCRSMPELTMRTGCGASCGSCVAMATEVLHDARQGQVRTDHVRTAAEDLLPALPISHAA